MSVFTVDLKNQPGELARLCEAMADRGPGHPGVGGRPVADGVADSRDLWDAGRGQRLCGVDAADGPGCGYSRRPSGADRSASAEHLWAPSLRPHRLVGESERGHARLCCRCLGEG